MANRPKMDRSERAKQFMPFAALKGYEEALREKERQVSLSENQLSLARNSRNAAAGKGLEK